MNKVFGGGGNMAGMMKKMQKLQAEMGKMQDAFKIRIFDTAAGGGAVKITMNGEKKIVALKINPEAVDAADIEMLEDMIVAAINEAMTTVDDAMEKEMSKLTGGMGMPPGLL